MREIPLTQGKYALVDDEDYERIVAMGPWHYNNLGYALRSKRVGKNIEKIYMHREVMNTPMGLDTDHRNHNRLDNRKANLRICTRSQNQQNRRKMTGNSKYKGVSYYMKDKRWSAKIRVEGELIYLGYYEDELEAAMVYDQSAIKYFGDFANLNFPKEL